MNSNDESISRTKLIQYITDCINYNASLDPQHEEKKTLKLANLQVESLPSESIELIKDSVERLSLQKNLLTNLPSNFSHLQNLKYLDIHKNKFTTFPSILTYLSNLEILDISFNQITHISDDFDFGYLKKNLKVLSIKANNFNRIPKSLSSLKSLRLLEIDENPLSERFMQVLKELNKIETNEEWIKQLYGFLSTLPSSEERTPMEDTDDRKTLKNHDNNAIDELPKLSHKQLERSRSASESFVSSKAAKRMGFVIKRPNQDFSNEIIKENEPQPTASKNQLSKAGSSTNLANHAASEPNRNRSFTTSTVSSPVTPELKVNSAMHIQSKENSEDNVSSKKLSTLPESKSPLGVSSASDLEILSIAKKIKFSTAEFQTSLSKLIKIDGLSDRFTKDLNGFIVNIKNVADQLDSSITRFENDKETEIFSVDDVVKTVILNVSNFKKSIEYLEMNLVNALRGADTSFIRSLFLSLFLSCSELLNAFKILSPNQVQLPTQSTANNQNPSKYRQLPPLKIPDNSNNYNNNNMTIAQQQLNDYNEIDDKLYDSLSNLLNVSSQVYSELNNAIAKSAIANAKQNNSDNESETLNPQHQLPTTLINKIKDLTNTCVTSMELNKKIKLKLITPPNKSFTLQEKKKIYDEINSFLKSIITILGSTKSIMNESMILNEVRQSFATLTKCTKDVTIVLEMSSYRMINDTLNKESSSLQSSVPQSATSMQPPVSAIQVPLLTSIPSVMSIPQMSIPSILGSSTNSSSLKSAGPQSAQFHHAFSAHHTPHTAQHQVPVGSASGVVTTPSVHSAGLQHGQNNPFEVSMMNNMNSQHQEGIQEE